jgi:SSS family solute:Na+ symporter
LVWQVLLWFAMCACWQTTAMRMFATNSPSTAKRVMTWTGVIFLGRGMLPMLWGICALTLFGTGAIGADGSPTPMVNGHAVAPIEAMPAMIAQLLGPGVKGIVVAGMLAATMSVNSSYLLGWSSVLSQDVILPIRKKLGKGDMSSKSQILINRLANVGVSLFVMFWGLYYPLSGATYMYLNITGTIFLSGAFVAVVGGLYWSRANLIGGYAAMLSGAAGAIIPFFFLHWNANKVGFCAFGMAFGGLLIGSLFGKAPAPQLSAAE